MWGLWLVFHLLTIFQTNRTYSHRNNNIFAILIIIIIIKTQYLSMLHLGRLIIWETKWKWSMHIPTCLSVMSCLVYFLVFWFIDLSGKHDRSTPFFFSFFYWQNNFFSTYTKKSPFDRRVGFNFQKDHRIIKVFYCPRFFALAFWTSEME